MFVSINKIVDELSEELKMITNEGEASLWEKSHCQLNGKIKSS